MSMKSFFGHLHTVGHHRRLVRKGCFKLGLYWQGLTHDLSKYSLVELCPGVKYYLGDRSPNEKERELFGYSAAWLHHKGKNKHHFEYWFDFCVTTKRYEPVKMPLKYVKEMFCDRIAASKTYQKEKYTNSSALIYYLGHNAREKMHVDTADLLESWLYMLQEKGEEETFKYIKSIKEY